MSRSGAAPFLVVLVAATALSACGGPSVAPASATVRSAEGAHALDPSALALAREVWSGLEGTHNTCDEFDYFPDGGIRIFACHVFSLASYERIVGATSLAPFVSGPHQGGLDLHATDDFGHYDPAFVRFVAEHAVPAQRDSALRAATQAHYDRYVAPLARILFATHQKLADNPACAAAELAEYRAAIERGDTRDYVEPWFFFMNDTYCRHRRGEYEDYDDYGFDGGYDGNVVKTSVGFWLRRTLDGTESTFFDALVVLMDTYEPSPAR